MKAERDWMIRAACRGDEPEKWFPMKAAQAAEAKSLCRTCPAIDECSEYADKLDIKHGVWGGKFRGDGSTRERNDGRRDHDTKTATMRTYRHHLKRNEKPCTACQVAADRAYRKKYQRSLQRAGGCR